MRTDGKYKYRAFTNSSAVKAQRLYCAPVRVKSVRTPSSTFNQNVRTMTRVEDYSLTLSRGKNQGEFSQYSYIQLLLREVIGPL